MTVRWRVAAALLLLLLAPTTYAQVVPSIDYDTNDNGLIDISTLAQLNAVRWDLDGDGAPSSAATSSYFSAFPDASAGMGCPTTADDADDNDCTGYELMNDLDFDTDGSGFTWRDVGGAITGDANDAYNNGGSGWDPIGDDSGNRFSTTFKGNGYTISNLFINRGTRDDTGLFGALDTGDRIESLGLLNAYVHGDDYLGALTGSLYGTIAACYATGRVIAATSTTSTGGLAGYSEGVIAASYSMVSVSGIAVVGGLIGHLDPDGRIDASYAAGAVSATRNAGGLVGLKFRVGGGGTVSTSTIIYWDTTTTGQTRSGDGAGKTTAELQAPAAYGTTTIYSTWDDVDVDGDGTAGVALDADDDAWDFGLSNQYPVLKLANFDTATQFNAQPDHPPAFAGATVEDKTYQRGLAIEPFQMPAAGGGNGAIAYAATGLPAGLSFDADGTGRCAAVRTVCGTPSANGTSTVTVTATDGDDNEANTDAATLTFGIAVVTPTAALAATSPATLTESNLNNATLTVKLTDTTFAAGVTASSFTLTTDVPGLTLGSVAPPPSGATSTTLTLAYAGADFDTARTLSLTVKDAAHALAGDLTTGPVAVSPLIAVRVSPRNVSVNEAAGSTDANKGTYEVVLESAPAVSATVTATSADAAVTLDGDGSPLTTALTFTAQNWSTAQTVTATAAEDDDAADESVSVTHAVTGYGGVTTAPGVTVEVDDDETARIVLDADPTTLAIDGGPLALTENASANYTVRLATPPTATVTVTISVGASGSPGALTFSTSTLKFSTRTWSTAQTVAATAADDDDGGDESLTIAHLASGVEYAGVSAALQASVSDDDTPGLVLATSTLVGLGVDEGGTATYAVRLATEPAGVATVSVAATGGVEVDMDGGQAGVQSSLRFDATNWNTARTATVRGLPDDDGADGTATLRHAASGADYGGAAALSTTFAVHDDDARAVLAGSTALDVNEGSTAVYTVVLSTRPVGGAVTVSALSTAVTVATVSPATLRFGAGDWNVPKTFRVRGVADADDADGSATIAHAVSGADYDGASTAPVSVSVRDADAAGVRLEPPALTLVESGRGVYRVRLNTQPAGDATVTATSGSAELAVDGDGTPQERTLTFTTENWDREQTVTATVGTDDGVDDETLTVSHAVSGYAGVSSAPTLPVRVEDDDAPGLAFAPAGGLQLTEGEPSSATGTYRVWLTHAPSATTTVAVTSDDAGVTADPAALAFGVSNWSTAQTVTVRTVSDGDAASETATLLHLASGGGYDGATGRYLVRVSDADAAPAPTGVSASAAGATSLTVRWTPSAGAAGHLVQWRRIGEAWSATRQLSAASGARSARIDGLSTGVEYEVRVLGLNRGDPGEPSTATRATPTAGRANRAPAPSEALEDVRLEPGETWTTDLAGAFLDPDGDVLSYEALSLDETVAVASASGAELRLRAVGAGQATVYVWAVDPGGLQGSQTLLATVSSERPTLSATAVADAPEGGAARLSVELSAPRRTATRFLWSTAPDADPSTADADAADFAASSGEATIPAGATRTEVAIAIAEDAEIEPAREWFEVSLSVPDGCCVAPGVRARMAVLEGVCDRTPAVRDALRGEGVCSAPTPASLAAVRTLTASVAGSLRAGDFGGLAGLRTLDLSDGDLGSLPAEAFAGLASLRELDLSNNALSALPAGTFAALSRLRTLDLSGNALATLPESPFSNLSRLRTLLLEDNALETLPMGLFAGLGGLREASLWGNPGAPFALAVELARVDADPWAAGPATVEARLASAAPFALRAALSAEPVATDPDAPLPSAVEIAAGESSGTPFRVVAPMLWLHTGPVVLSNDRCGEEDAPRLCFRGFTAALGPMLTLFGHPLATQPAPRLDVLSGGDGLRLPVAWLVAASAAADLRWRASSSDGSVATARIRNGMLEVEPEPGGEGTVEIVLVAMDDAGLATTVRFSVQVNFHWPMRQASGWRGAIAAPAPN